MTEREVLQEIVCKIGVLTYGKERWFKNNGCWYDRMNGDYIQNETLVERICDELEAEIEAEQTKPQRDECEACSYPINCEETVCQGCCRKRIFEPKTEPNCSEKPNNCEHITEDGVTCAKYPACDDCLDNPLNKVKGSERLLKGKDEPQTEHLEQFRVGLEYHTDTTHFGKTKGESVTTNKIEDEPQKIYCPKCGRSDYIKDLEKDFGVKDGTFKYKCINCNTYIKDEPMTDCGDFANRLAYERGVKHAWEVAQKVFDSTVTFYEAEDVAKQITKGEPQTDCAWR